MKRWCLRMRHLDATSLGTAVYQLIYYDAFIYIKGILHIGERTFNACRNLLIANFNMPPKSAISLTSGSITLKF